MFCIGMVEIDGSTLGLQFRACLGNLRFAYQVSAKKIVIVNMIGYPFALNTIYTTFIVTPIFKPLKPSQFCACHRISRHYSNGLS
jgi:hypothetical protein